MKAITFFRLMGMLLLPYVLPLGPNLFAQGAVPIVKYVHPIAAVAAIRCPLNSSL
jgi:hypothetical protein